MGDIARRTNEAMREVYAFSATTAPSRMKNTRRVSNRGRGRPGTAPPDRPGWRSSGRSVGWVGRLGSSRADANQVRSNLPVDSPFAEFAGPRLGRRHALHPFACLRCEDGFQIGRPGARPFLCAVAHHWVEPGSSRIGHHRGRCQLDRSSTAGYSPSGRGRLFGLLGYIQRVVQFCCKAKEEPDGGEFVFWPLGRSPSSNTSGISLLISQGVGIPQAARDSHRWLRVRSPS